MIFDILITAAKKDFNKLPFVLSGIERNIRGYNNIHIISNHPVPDEYLVNGTIQYRDHEALDYDFLGIDMENRRGWYRQQFIKLLQTTTTDDYLVIDADVYINKPMKINTGNPSFYLGRDQYHMPYFQCFDRICGLKRSYDHSFICEIMFFKRDIINMILEEIGLDRYDFLNRCVEMINKVNNGSGFSEYEFYGNYVTSRWPGAYQYKKIKVLHNKKYRKWYDEEIRQYVENNSHSDYDILTMHSWYDDNSVS